MGSVEVRPGPEACPFRGAGKPSECAPVGPRQMQARAQSLGRGEAIELPIKL